MVCGPFPKKRANTCGHCSSIGFIPAELFGKGLCSWASGSLGVPDLAFAVSLFCTSVSLSDSVAVDCIVLNFLGKHKRKMAIRAIKLTAKQPTATKLTRRDQYTDSRLHYHYIAISELRWFDCGDYHSDLLHMGTIYWWPFIYMWCHLHAATIVYSCHWYLA